MERLSLFKKKMLEALHEAFEEDHTDREIAFSFAFGILVTALPTLGVGLILFAALIRFTSFISGLAIGAAIVIMNPVTKWLFYLASINVGALIFTGRIAGVTGLENALVYLLTGSIVLAVALSILSYFIALRFVRAYRKTDLDIVEEVDEVIEEELEALE